MQGCDRQIVSSKPDETEPKVRQNPDNCQEIQDSSKQKKQMTTPIEEVFRQLRETKKPDSWGLAYCVDFLFEFEQELLEKEKVAIMQALNDGKGMALGTIENKSLEQYYNETFNTTDE